MCGVHKLMVCNVPHDLPGSGWVGARVGIFPSRVEVVLQEADTDGSDEAKYPENQISIFEIESIPSDVDVAT